MRAFVGWVPISGQDARVLKDAVTPAGALVLEGMALLREVKTAWEEVEV